MKTKRFTSDYLAITGSNNREKNKQFLLLKLFYNQSSKVYLLLFFIANDINCLILASQQAKPHALLYFAG